jgi:murein DD-endopeptidase MepM/ murein hydrolase activator NlpD
MKVNMKTATATATAIALNLLCTVAAHAQISESIETVACAPGANTELKSKDGQQVIAQLPRATRIKVFQSWEKLKAGTQNQSLKKVQLAEAVNGIQYGWIDSENIMTRAECSPQLIASRSQVKEIGKLNFTDPNCCNFPLPSKPNADFASGMRRFGANRGGGSRLHAACDLYKTTNSPILAVTDGTVVQDLYRFYQGTYALEVKHTGGFVVRYGEVTGREANGISGGSRVRKGQQVGYMGKVNSGCCEPMLHFELFKGTARGSLSGGDNSYQRRSDLVNPTTYLQRWLKK